MTTAAYGMGGALELLGINVAVRASQTWCPSGHVGGVEREYAEILEDLLGAILGYIWLLRT